VVVKCSKNIQSTLYGKGTTLTLAKQKCQPNLVVWCFQSSGFKDKNETKYQTPIHSIDQILEFGIIYIIHLNSTNLLTRKKIIPLRTMKTYIFVFKRSMSSQHLYKAHKLSSLDNYLQWHNNSARLVILSTKWLTIESIWVEVPFSHFHISRNEDCNWPSSRNNVSPYSSNFMSNMAKNVTYITNQISWHLKVVKWLEILLCWISKCTSDPCLFLKELIRFIANQSIGQ
jgi:hypothetical protein